MTQQERDNIIDGLANTIEYYLTCLTPLSAEQLKDFQECCNRLACFGEEAEEYVNSARKIMFSD